MMWHAAALSERNLRRGNLNPPVNLHGVTVDDFSAETQRQLDSQRALAGSSRSNDSDDAGSAGVPPAFFLQLKDFVGMTHPREMISRITIPSQMITSRMIAPMIWFREKRMDRSIYDLYTNEAIFG